MPYGKDEGRKGRLEGFRGRAGSLATRDEGNN